MAFEFQGQTISSHKYLHNWMPEQKKHRVTHILRGNAIDQHTVDRVFFYSSLFLLASAEPEAESQKKKE